MSRTFTLVGRSSVLEAEIVPEIDLDKKYGIALVGLYTYNSIPNIEEKIILYRKREETLGNHS